MKNNQGPQDKKLAAALGFDPKSDNAPRFLAGGSGSLAEKIVQIARENGKPVIADPQLAKLLQTLKVGEEIPENLFRAVALIFGLIYNLEERE